MSHVSRPQGSPGSNAASTNLWLFGIFTLSGFTGLIYQSIWSHYLGLMLGHAAFAQALVLAIFMGGMAAGAAWISRMGHRWRNLLRGYALIEAAVGICGLVFHEVYGLVAQATYEWLIPALGDSALVNGARWAVAALLILPQTVLLGMTFPLMSGGLIRRYPGSDGRLLGTLYFTNSIGAAMGALAAVFLLLPVAGLPGAMALAGWVNLVVAGMAWHFARVPEPAASGATGAQAAPETRRRACDSLLGWVLLSTALSGAASFVYEIVWVRMLSMAVGSTMHAFELMLAAFIAGIALGGLWVRKRADASADPLRLAGWMQVFMGVAALGSLAIYANAFSWVGWLMQALARTDGGYVLFNLGTAGIAIAVMLPAAFFAGTTLPLFTVALLRAGQGERAIGRVYAWNTLGSIAGVFAAIHLLIPVLGLKAALCAGALVDLVIGLLLLGRGRPAGLASWLPVGAGAALAAVALAGASRVPFDARIVASGVFRHGDSSLKASDEVIFYEDGKTASVAAVKEASGFIQISTNGKTDAAIQMREGAPGSADEPTMVMLGSLPLALHEAPRRVGVIGFGSGLTTHTLLGDARVEHVDTVEIEPAMVRGARQFGPRVARAYEDPRSRIVIDDAKAYFAGQRSRYDVIVSEPSNPWISGVGALFSKEFYQFVPRHLNDRGLFVQWVQLYELDEALLGSILQALTPAFEDYSAWLANDSDLVIVATPRGRLPALNLAPLLSQSGSRADLLRVGVSNGAQLSFRQVADAGLLRGMARLYSGLPANSDFHPVLGLKAPEARFKGTLVDSLMRMPMFDRSLLEALNIAQPLPLEVAVPEGDDFPADPLTRRARALAEEMRANALAYTPEVHTLQATVRDCTSAWSNARLTQFAASAGALARRTVKFLPPQAMEGVWLRPDWLGCDMQALPMDVQRALALLAAHASRDYVQMELLGRDWTERRPAHPALQTHFDGYAWSGGILAMLRDGRRDQLSAWLAEMNRSGFNDPEYAFLRRLAPDLRVSGTAPVSGAP